MTDNFQLRSKSVLSQEIFPYDRTYRSVLIMEIFLLGALFVLDVCTTEYILINGGQELNEIMAGIVTTSSILHLFVKGCVLAMIVATIFYANRIIRHSGTAALVILIGWYISVTCHNLGVIFL